MLYFCLVLFGCFSMPTFHRRAFHIRELLIKWIRMWLLRFSSYFVITSCLLFGSKCVKFQNCTWKNRNIVCAESEWNANSRRLRLHAMLHSLRSLFATTISTEPVILFLNLGVGIVYGSGLPTYLQYEKVCRFTLGYDEETCDNLGEEENEDASVEVNEFINRFNLVGTLVRTVLSAIVNLFIGSFVDKYGMKAAIYLALVGGYAKSCQTELTSCNYHRSQTLQHTS